MWDNLGKSYSKHEFKATHEYLSTLDILAWRLSSGKDQKKKKLRRNHKASRPTDVMSHKLLR